MNCQNQKVERLKPRLALVVATWSHESGADYATKLIDLFPITAPTDNVDIIVCPQLLESEFDIPSIVSFFKDKNPDALCIIAGNFTMDHVMPILSEALKIPTVLWGLPTREAWGSLVSVQQTVFPFKELGLPYRFVTGRLDDRNIWDDILPYIRAAALQKYLMGLRIGLMGWRAQGMSDVVFDELTLRSTLGVQLINIGLTTYERTMQTFQKKEIEETWRQIQVDFDTTELPDDVGRYGVRSYLAMRRFVSRENLQAITVECFHDHLGGPCLGFCLLNDQGIAAPCENDIPAAILMAIAQNLTGEPTFHTDIVEADYKENFAILHHCGNLPLRLINPGDKPVLKPIRETAGPGAYGPTIQATMKSGPITAANLVCGRSGLRLCSLEGEVIPSVIDLPGSKAKVSFPFSLREALEKIGNEGYGHHFVLIQGHVSRDLADWCNLSGIRYLQAGASS